MSQNKDILDTLKQQQSPKSANLQFSRTLQNSKSAAQFSRTQNLQNNIQQYNSSNQKSSILSPTQSSIETILQYNNKYPLAPMFSHQQTYKTIKIRSMQSQPLLLFDHASYLNSQNTKYITKVLNKQKAKFKQTNIKLEQDKLNNDLGQLLKQTSIMFQRTANQSTGVSGGARKSRQQQFQTYESSPTRNLVNTESKLIDLEINTIEQKNPSLLNKTPFKNEKILKSSFPDDSQVDQFENCTPETLTQESPRNKFLDRQFFQEKILKQRQVDTDKMKKIMQNKYKEKLRLLDMKYNIKQELIDRNQIKDRQGRRLFSQSGGNTFFKDGRLTHIRQDLEPFSEKTNYMECAEQAKTQSQFYTIAKRIEKSKQIHFNHYVSMNRLPLRNSHIKEAYNSIKLNNIQDEILPSYKRLGLFTPQASSTNFFQSRQAVQTGLKTQLSAIDPYIEIQNAEGDAHENQNIETSQLLKQEFLKDKANQRIQEHNKIEGNLHKKRIVNITLDSDLDQPINGQEQDFQEYNLDNSQQLEVIYNDPVKEQERRYAESQRWMERYNKKVFEGKVYKLKQNLNLVLHDMQQTQIKIMDFHSNMTKVIDDVEDDLIVLENMRRLNAENGKKRR
ncbi:UNKNOWN [Stylonychia lemnae]|uniref:Uncharacterized protein n=1 Tax=Stylonychia lemnae TaxID=5949 RepID=A0A078AT72_STYLE|nr:UNKNOWN [Stylonychia lemnae]|eukprot:CDW84078.1 UNKNOWN [Stylonychia lemnae]